MKYEDKKIVIEALHNYFSGKLEEMPLKVVRGVEKCADTKQANCIMKYSSELTRIIEEL